MPKSPCLAIYALLAPLWISKTVLVVWIFVKEISQQSASQINVPLYLHNSLFWVNSNLEGDEKKKKHKCDCIHGFHVSFYRGKPVKSVLQVSEDMLAFASPCCSVHMSSTCHTLHRELEVKLLFIEQGVGRAEIQEFLDVSISILKPTSPNNPRATLMAALCELNTNEYFMKCSHWYRIYI
ncbi:hypothetical protein KY289_003395 [Solanum tuberosum]|nr:hypothetical protein KY289_003395 [Solanum tuberosum]